MYLRLDKPKDYYAFNIPFLTARNGDSLFRKICYGDGIVSSD